MIKRLNWVIFVFLNQFPEKVLSNDSQKTGLGAIAKGGFINFIGLFFSIAANFSYQFILVRTLSTADVGLFNLSFTLTGLIGLVVLFGLDRTVVRYVVYYMGKNDRARELGTIISSTKVLLALALFVTPLFFLGAESIAQFVFKKPDLAPILRLFILGVPFVTLTRLYMGVLQGYKLMRPMVLIEQIAVPALRLVGVAIVILTLAPTSILITSSFFIGSIIGGALSIIAVTRYYTTRKKKVKPIPVYSDLLKFSWPFFGASLLNRTNTYTETLILGGLSSSEQVGLFTVSFKIAITITVIFQAINTILAPFITEVFAQGDINKLAYQLKVVTRWIFTLTLPVALVIFLEATDIMVILKPEYASSASILQILTLSQLVYAVAGPIALVLTMTRYAKLNLVDLILTLILSFILDFVFIPRFGAYGAAIAGGISIVFINILRLLQVYFIFRIHPYSWSTAKPVIAGGVASILTTSCSPLLQDASHLGRLIVLSIVLFSTYGIVLLALRQDEADKEVFKMIARDFPKNGKEKSQV